MSRLPVTALMIVSLSVVTASASAQEAHPDDAVVPRPAFNPMQVNRDMPLTLLGAAPLSLSRPVPLERPTRPSSALLLSLYASTAAMQALDVHSTMTALGKGAAETNPLMKGVVRNKMAFVAMKAGLAASTILATRNAAKHNKFAAIATLVAINATYAVVMRHNYLVARRQR